jgi:hypothetical protein
MSTPYSAGGAKISICTTAQYVEPASIATYSALTWQEIGDVESIGEYGDEAQILTAATLQDSRVFKAKGARDGGTLSLTCLDRPDDTGQQALITAEGVNPGMFAFKVELPTTPGASNINYFCAKISSKRLNVGTAANIVRRGFNLAITTQVLQVLTPRDISGLLAWFESSDSSNYALSGGGVLTWSDLSGNNNHLRQATLANRPTIQAAAQNGLDTIRFTAASSQKMLLDSEIDVDAAYTVAAVVRNGGPTGTGEVVLFGHSANANRYAPHWWAGDSRLYWSNSGGKARSDAVVDTASYHVVILTLTGGTATAELDGADIYDAYQVVASAAALFDQIGSGSGVFMNGEVGEIALYGSVLSAANRTVLYNYLKDKWGTP